MYLCLIFISDFIFFFLPKHLLGSCWCEYGWRSAADSCFCIFIDATEICQARKIDSYLGFPFCASCWAVVIVLLLFCFFSVRSLILLLIRICFTTWTCEILLSHYHLIMLLAIKYLCYLCMPGLWYLSVGGSIGISAAGFLSYLFAFFFFCEPQHFLWQ